MIQSNRFEGIVRGSIEGDVAFDFVSRETSVAVGDVIITSGMGGVYPKGLLVGEVITVTKTPSSLYQEIVIAPSADLVGLEEVVVLTASLPGRSQSVIPNNPGTKQGGHQPLSGASESSGTACHEP